MSEDAKVKKVTTVKGFAVIGRWGAGDHVYPDERTAWACCFSGWDRYSRANQDAMIEKAKADGVRVVRATLTLETADV